MKPDETKIASLQSALSQFSGSEQLFENPLFKGYVYTEGVKYLAEEAGAYWLIDHVFVNQMLDVLKNQPFQVWNISVEDNASATIVVEDGDKNKLTFFTMGYTDFPLKEFSLWLVDGTLLLPREY